MSHFGVRDLVRMSWRTLRAEPARVIVPGLIVFTIASLGDTLLTRIETSHVLNLVEALLALAVATVGTLGLTFYAGLLDRLVGAVEEGREAPPVRQVLRTLPYGRLLVADLILLAILVVAAATFILPGLILMTLFAIVGPLINLQGHGIVKAFRESFRLLLPNFWTAALAITLPLAVEHEVVSAIELAFPHEALRTVLFTQAIVTIAVGTVVGLLEVSLAEHAVHGVSPLPREAETR
jgi:hypothetical protein